MYILTVTRYFHSAPQKFPFRYWWSQTGRYCCSTGRRSHPTGLRGRTMHVPRAPQHNRRPRIDETVRSIRIPGNCPQWIERSGAARAGWEGRGSGGAGRGRRWPRNRPLPNGPDAGWGHVISGELSGLTVVAWGVIWPETEWCASPRVVFQFFTLEKV